MSGAELAIAGVLAAASAGLSYSQARETNRARRQQNRAVEQAAKAEQATAKMAAAERRETVARQQAQFLGTVRASSAARSASSTSLQISGISQGQEAVADINTQLMFDILGISSRGEAQKDRNRTNPFLAGAQGGLSGFSTGLSIGTSLKGAGYFDNEDTGGFNA